jgi:N-acylneuraminate cytidylyltransferase
LIAYSIEAALASKLVDRVIVSTDDAEIAAVARRFGAEVPFMRPSELATDDSPEWLTWQHAIKTLEAMGAKLETFVCVSPTSPFRAVEDIDHCIRALQESGADLVMTVTTTARNPYYNMFVLDPQGYARVVIPPERAIHRRQDAPQVYDGTTVAYAARPEYVLNASAFFEGKIKAVVVPPERAVDIDTELDFKFVEFLLSQRAVTT